METYNKVSITFILGGFCPLTSTVPVHGELVFGPSWLTGRKHVQGPVVTFTGRPAARRTLRLTAAVGCVRIAGPACLAALRMALDLTDAEPVFV